MVNLEQLLKECRFGKEADEEKDKQRIAQAIAPYLDSHPAITTVEIQNGQCIMFLVLRKNEAKN